MCTIRWKEAYEAYKFVYGIDCVKIGEKKLVNVRK